MVKKIYEYLLASSPQTRAQYSNAPVHNKSAVKEEVELTTRITGEANNSIKDAIINNQT